MKKVTDFLARLMAGHLNTPGRFLSALRNHREQETYGVGAEDAFERFLGENTNKGFDAPERLKVPEPYFTTEPMLARLERADWQHVDPHLRFFSAKLVEALRRQGVPLYVHTAYRTPTEQRKLVSAGRSRTMPPRAAHCQGAAVDIVHGRYHWELSRQEWALIGKIGKQIADRMKLPVTWGGDWKFYDPAHWELTGWQNGPLATLTTGEPIRHTSRYILRHLPPPDD